MKSTTVKCVITFIGVGMLIIGLLVYSVNSNYTQEYTDTVGVVTDIQNYGIDKESKYTVTIRYTAIGTTYNSNLGFYNKGLNTGDYVNIAYENDSPSDIIYVGDTYKIPMLMIGAGIIIATIGLIGLLTAKSKQFKNKRYINVSGNIREIVREVNSDNMYYAVVTAVNPKTSKVVEIRSRLMTLEEAKELRDKEEICIAFDIINNSGSLIEA